jgi:hypothetical protein
MQEGSGRQRVIGVTNGKAQEHADPVNVKHYVLTKIRIPQTPGVFAYTKT